MLQLFDKYFLFLMVIQGVVVGFKDRSNFYGSGNESVGRKAYLVSLAMIVLSFVLYISARLS